MKRILITGGPTVEPIDDVMKITNMSTGKLSSTLARMFLNEGYEVTLILNQGVEFNDKHKNLELVKVETTDEMLNALHKASQNKNYDCIIHASAVGDYKADFSFLMDDLAEEIFGQIDKIKSPEDLLNIMKDPKCKLNDDTKISSYQQNLTVKLGLTPKIIGNLHDWFNGALLVGCKLLEGVPKEELFQVATKLCIKNNMDYIMANDLADLRAGKPARYLVDKDGYTGKTLGEPEDIFNFIVSELNK